MASSAVFAIKFQKFVEKANSPDYYGTTIQGIT